MTDKTVTSGGMETLVLLRDECRALSNALELAMVDGYGGDDLRALRRRALELAGSLALWVGGGRGFILADSPARSIDEQIERFLDEQDLRDELERRKAEYASFAFEKGKQYASALRELEHERIASARLREQVAEARSERDAVHRHAESCERKIAKLMLELEQVRGLVGRA
jgi:hypothetical protein